MPAVVWGRPATPMRDCRCWWHVPGENINPRQPTRLPLLFALDAKLRSPTVFITDPVAGRYAIESPMTVARSIAATDFPAAIDGRRHRRLWRFGSADGGKGEIAAAEIPGLWRGCGGAETDPRSGVTHP